MNKYSWRDGCRAPKGMKAEVAAKELARLEESAGALTPEVVVESAKDKRSPLHSVFEWNNAKAAHQHRLEQARHLIASIEVIYEQAPVVGAVRAYVNVESGDGRRYARTEDALSFSDVRQRVLTRALQEASDWQRRYKQITELSEVFVAIDHAKDQIKTGAA